MVPVPGSPFGVAATRDGRWVFVATETALVVYAVDGRTLHETREVALTGSPAGLMLTGDDRFVLVATGHGVTVVDAARARTGATGAVVAVLDSPGSDGATEVAESNDGTLVFVTFEKSNDLAVFRFRGGADRPVSGTLVGTVAVGRAPVGLAVSPDGRWLYVTSQSRLTADTTTGPMPQTAGTVSVLDVARSATDPVHAVVAAVDAGCSPVRVVASSDGATIWVSARGSDTVIEFWTDRLRTDPAHATAATVAVGAEPVGLAITDDGWLVVANSNRSSPRTVASLAVIDARAASDRQPALRAYVPAGRFPREVTTLPNTNTVVVGDYDSQQLQLVTLTGLR
jgi:DNA-binding beta-propeller fold protein YncE